MVIYILFANGFILGPGAELEKKDWLAFLSGYLSFAGSLIVGCIAICQSRFFAQNRRENDTKGASFYLMGMLYII